MKEYIRYVRNSLGDKMDDDLGIHRPKPLIWDCRFAILYLVSLLFSTQLWKEIDICRSSHHSTTRMFLLKSQYILLCFSFRLSGNVFSSRLKSRIQSFYNMTLSIEIVRYHSETMEFASKVVAPMCISNWYRTITHDTPMFHCVVIHSMGTWEPQPYLTSVLNLLLVSQLCSPKSKKMKP